MVLHKPTSYKFCQHESDIILLNMISEKWFLIKQRGKMFVFCCCFHLSPKNKSKASTVPSAVIPSTFLSHSRLLRRESLPSQPSSATTVTLTTDPFLCFCSFFPFSNTVIGAANLTISVWFFFNVPSEAVSSSIILKKKEKRPQKTVTVLQQARLICGTKCNLISINSLRARVCLSRRVSVLWKAFKARFRFLDVKRSAHVHTHFFYAGDAAKVTI